MNTDAASLKQRLSGVIRLRPSLLTAWSGGIDSTLVAAVAREILGRSRAPAAIGNSLSLPRQELDETRQLAASLDIELIEVQPDEQADPAYQANNPDRCFFCKQHLYASLQAEAGRRGIVHIASGTNLDDLGEHRPGLKAAEEAGIIHPLVEAGFTKQNVRTLAAHMNLPNAGKPAAACLASRIPYGTQVTPQRLERVESAENILKSLGFSGFRVRHHEDLARIELPIEQMGHFMDAKLRQQVVEGFQACGYRHVTVDLAGYRRGSTLEVLNPAPGADSTRSG